MMEGGNKGRDDVALESREDGKSGEEVRLEKRGGMEYVREREREEKTNKHGHGEMNEDNRQKDGQWDA